MFKTLLLGAANDEENSIKASVTLSDNVTEYLFVCFQFVLSGLVRISSWAYFEIGHT